MKTRLIAVSTALTLALSTASAAPAETSEVAPAWQEPGYVMEVVVVTGKRPPTIEALDARLGSDTVMAAEQAMQTEPAAHGSAMQDAGHTMEIVIVKASRSEVLADFRAAIASRISEHNALY